MKQVLTGLRMVYEAQMLHNRLGFCFYMLTSYIARILSY